MWEQTPKRSLVSVSRGREGNVPVNLKDAAHCVNYKNSNTEKEGHLINQNPYGFDYSCTSYTLDHNSGLQIIALFLKRRQKTYYFSNLFVIQPFGK